MHFAPPLALRAEVSNNVVQVAPVTRIDPCPILGLALQTDSGVKSNAYRVVMFVKGNSKSKLSSLGLVPSSASDVYLVESTKVTCRLSETETFVDLRGRCNFETM